MRKTLKVTLNREEGMKMRSISIGEADVERHDFYINPKSKEVGYICWGDNPDITDVDYMKNIGNDAEDEIFTVWYLNDEVEVVKIDKKGNVERTIRINQE